MRLRVPHPFVLLLAGVLVAMVLTYILPSGEFARQLDPATEREVVVPGTYERVAAEPVSPFGAAVAIPRGLIEAADVVFLVFLVGGAFTVVDRTGALRRAFERLVTALAHRELLVIPIAALAFATGGALENMQEEIIALVPVLLLLVTRLGFDPVVAVAMSAGAAMVGSAFSPINPFQVQIAQKVAGVPLLSGSGFRLVFLALALVIWIAATMWYARRNRVTAVAAVEGEGEPIRTSDLVVLALVLAAFAIYVYGVISLGWGFNELAAIFFVMGLLAGIIGGLRLGGTTDAFLDGFRDMAFAAILIGFARAIYVVLNDGRVIDTIVAGLAQPLGSMPQEAAAVGMVGVQALIHFAVPSVSGQAVLTLPIMAPLGDLLGISRQVSILAYQYGAGLAELFVPTNGALMAILASAGVGYGRWLKFVVPVYAALAVLGIVSIFIAMAIGL